MPDPKAIGAYKETTGNAHNIPAEPVIEKTKENATPPKCSVYNEVKWSKVVDPGNGEKTPSEIKTVNLELFHLYKCQDHFIRIENIKGKYYFVLRWRNGKALNKPVIISEYSKEKIKHIKSDYLIIDMNGSDLNIKDDNNFQKITTVKTESASDYLSAIVIPTNFSKGLANMESSEIKKILTEIYSAKDADFKLEQMGKNSPLFFASNQKAEFYEGEAMEITGVAPHVKPFIDKIRDGLTSDKKKAGIVLVVDCSGSMHFASAIIFQSIDELITSLEIDGFEEIYVGAVLFNDENVPNKVYPISKMDVDGIDDFYAFLGSVESYGGVEPVGRALKKGVDMIGESTSKDFSKYVLLMTDKDGLKDDKVYPPYWKDIADKSNDLGEITVDSYIVSKEQKNAVKGEYWKVNLRLAGLMLDKILAAKNPSKDDVNRFIGLAIKLGSTNDVSDAFNILQEFTLKVKGFYQQKYKIAKSMIGLGFEAAAKEGITKIFEKTKDKELRLKTAMDLIKWGSDIPKTMIEELLKEQFYTSSDYNFLVDAAYIYKSQGNVEFAVTIFKELIIKVQSTDKISNFLKLVYEFGDYKGNYESIIDVCCKVVLNPKFLAEEKAIAADYLIKIRGKKAVTSEIKDHINSTLIKSLDTMSEKHQISILNALVLQGSQKAQDYVADKLLNTVFNDNLVVEKYLDIILSMDDVTKNKHLEEMENEAKCWRVKVKAGAIIHPEKGISEDLEKTLKSNVDHYHKIAKYGKLPSDRTKATAKLIEFGVVAQWALLDLALHSKDLTIKLDAVLEVVDVGGPEVLLELFLKYDEEEKAGSIKYQAVCNLVKMGAKAKVENRMVAMKVKDKYLRLEAADVLIENGDYLGWAMYYHEGPDVFIKYSKDVKGEDYAEDFKDILDDIKSDLGSKSAKNVINLVVSLGFGKKISKVEDIADQILEIYESKGEKANAIFEKLVEIGHEIKNINDLKAKISAF